MKKILLLSTCFIFYAINGYATNQVIDITFTDGVRARYSNKGISFIDPVILSDNFVMDEDSIDIKGIHIDRSLSLKKVQEQLVSFHSVKNATITETQLTPDEKFQEEFHIYMKSYREDFSFDDETIYYRNFLNLVNSYISLGSKIAEQNLPVSQYNLACSLINYIWYLNMEELIKKPDALDILKEARTLYKDSSYKIEIVSKGIEDIKVILLKKGIAIGNYGAKQTNLTESIRLSRMGISFIETAQEMDHPEKKIVDTSLAQARTNLGVFLQETVRPKLLPFINFALASLNPSQINIPSTDRINAIVEILTPFQESASLFKLAVEHNEEARQRLIQLKVEIDAFGLTKFLKGLKQLHVVSKDILTAQPDNDKLASEVKNIEEYLEKIDPLVNSILSPVNGLETIVQDTEKYNLAIQYRDGNVEGYPKDSEKALNKALELFTELSDQGNEKAMHNKAMIHYKKGEYVQAYLWFKSASERGLQPSTNNLVKLVKDPALYSDFNKIYESVIK